MAKISEYDNYDTGKSQTEVAKFQETGVLPVSGKYTDNGNMTTKKVKLSDLVGGGSGLPEIGSNDDGKVLTVDTDHAVWAEPSGGKEYQGMAPISITGYSTPTVELNYSTDDFDIDLTETPNQLKLVRPVPSTLAANDGDVLTIDDHVAGSLTWTTPGGGGGDPLPDDVVWTIKSGITPEYPQKTGGNIECYITGFENGKAKLSWVWKLTPDGSGSFEGPVQSGAFEW